MKRVPRQILPFFIPHLGCPHRCVFCDQQGISGAASYPRQEEVQAAIAGWREETVPEIAFYGGSFTALSESWQEYFLRPAHQALLAGKISGIRVSTRPDAVSSATLALLRRWGVDTVELGVQSLDDRVLAEAERGHPAAASLAALALLREHGFRTGVQLMPGLPGDSREKSLRGALAIARWRPDMVRIYPTLVLRGTRLHQMYCEGCYQPLRLEEAVATCRDMLAIMEHHGVQVIRMGLQPSAEISPQALVAAGPWHPSFGELVAGALYREKMVMAWGMLPPAAKLSRALFSVNPRDCSLAAGHGGANRAYLQDACGLGEIRIKGLPELARGDLRLTLGDDPLREIRLHGPEFLARFTQPLLTSMDSSPEENQRKN